MIDFQDLVQPVEVYGYGTLGVLGHVDAPDDGRSAAVGNHRVSVLVSPGESRFELVLGSRVGDGVWRIVEVAAKGGQQLHRVAAVVVEQTIDGIGRHELTECVRYLDPGGPEFDVGDGGYRRRTDFAT